MPASLPRPPDKIARPHLRQPTMGECRCERVSRRVWPSIPGGSGGDPAASAGRSAAGRRGSGLSAVAADRLPGVDVLRAPFIGNGPLQQVKLNIGIHTAQPARIVGQRGPAALPGDVHDVSCESVEDAGGEE